MFRALLGAVLLVCVSGAGAGADAATSIVRSVLGGGAVGADASDHVVSSTLGQSAVGRSEANQHAVRSGFWVRGADSAGLPSAPLPTRFQLYAPVPNPFPGELTLRYDVPAPGGEVRLRIYDIAGRVVRTLVDEAVAPGARWVRWDGNDDRGNELACGLYVCLFQAPGYRRTQKLVRTR